MDKAELFARCEKIVTREELVKKLKENPDFVPEEFYCKGAGQYCVEEDLCVQLVARAHLPTRFGEFTLFGFYDGREDKEHTAVVRGEVKEKENVPLRVHSQCHTGDVLGSLRCDCREQLEASLKYIGEREFGVLIYLMQEGRGIGLLNKIKAYQLQDLGLDTVEANHFLGYPGEARDYRVAAKIIQLLGIRSVSLLTNNPDKIEKLRKEGVIITERLPLVIKPNPHDEFYLKTKKEKMGHLI
ncbi:MAG TPA: GTP cyclohydrolase II [Spirochaetales bacterium]|nr:GTP cyclohydrolase II [Spirochaetales bacterium]HOV39246.1 GTP cyclohydrolase II [Spirochaetales bacterium]